ncbi:helix-turn-helix domain-containing protein [Lacisediminihabitans sp. FW035]
MEVTTMAWSTSELAELAGTTLKAVRHYHKVGLLEEPERKSNGYKQYQVSHLLRLLQITRLAELGVPLAQIAALGHADKDPDQAIHVLDAELEATIDRLQRIRGELALILRHRAPAELPTGFSNVAGELSEADRALVLIYSRLFDEATMADLQGMVQEQPRTDVDKEFDMLHADADRATRRKLGKLLAPAMKAGLDKFPTLKSPIAQSPTRAGSARNAVEAAMHELYNIAQLEVLYRSHLISTGKTKELDVLEAALDALELDESD